MSIEEKRKFSRIDFDAPVTITHASKRLPARLLDISLKGMLTERPLDWADDINACHVSVQLPGHEIHMEVETAHTAKDKLGFKCTSIDLDSIASLRRMVELNLGDEAILEREITSMLELH